MPSFISSRWTLKVGLTGGLEHPDHLLTQVLVVPPANTKHVSVLQCDVMMSADQKATSAQNLKLLLTQADTDEKTEPTFSSHTQSNIISYNQICASCQYVLTKYRRPVGVGCFE